MKRWTEDQTYQFVRIYLKHELLWNPHNNNHRLQDKRLKAYREIIAEFRDQAGILINEAQLKLKARSLMSTYVQEKAKIRQRSTMGWTYTPNMKWFIDWHKCIMRRDDVPETDNSLDNQLPDSAELVNADSCQKVWLRQNHEDNTEEDSANVHTDDYNILILKTETNPESTSQNTGRSSYELPKKKENERRFPSTDYSDNTFRDSISSDLQDSTKEEREDEFDIYGKYIASQLRKMDIQKALRLKLEIHSLVSEARLSEIGGQ